METPELSYIAEHSAICQIKSCPIKKDFKSTKFEKVSTPNSNTAEHSAISQTPTKEGFKFKSVSRDVMYSKTLQNILQFISGQ